jgi:hypothetical protein
VIEKARQPSLRDVLIEQVRVLWISLRLPALVGVALAGVATTVALPTMAKGGPLSINGWPTWLPGIMGTLLPIAVWGKDDRFGPGFLWTLPVDRQRHAFTKVAAGWIWLMAGVMAFLSWLFIMVGITGEHVLPQTINLLVSPVAPVGLVDPTTVRGVAWHPGPLMGIVPFAGATACYLLSSALVIGTRHPLRWVIGVVMFGVLTAVISEPLGTGLGMRWLAVGPGRVMELLAASRYGLDALLTARSETLSTTATLTTGKSMRVWWGVPDLADWAVATLIWATLGVVSLWAAVSRHGERRRV